MNIQTNRQSNMELLRIVSMLLILIIHADFYSIPYSIPKWTIVEGADAGVNCFILISGYFGIRPKIKSFLTFIFQILFFVILGDLIRIAIGEGLSCSGFLSSLNILNFNWFINSYIALYVFSPVLNSFAENATKKEFQWFLILWGSVEFLMGYTIDYLKFERGYSFQAFIFLYMIARYIKIYGGSWCNFNKYTNLSLYFVFTFLTAIIMYGLETIGKGIGAQYYLRAYNSPFMIIASICLLLYFSKITIHSTFINWMGKSAYAAFLLHCIIYDDYRLFHHELFLKHHWSVACLYSIIVIVIVFTTALLIDQIRIFLWGRLLSLLEKNKI